MKLGDVLQLGKSKSISIDDDKEYIIGGVSSYGLGVKNRRNELGKDLKMKKYQVIEKDYLMWCKVDTKKGAFGVTKDEHIGSLASTNMALAKIDKTKIHPDFLEFLFRFKPFHENITHLSSGSTNRKYLTPQQLSEQIEIPDLTIVEQLNFLKIQENIKIIGLDKEITHQLDLIKNLRQAFLREAMQGLLVSNETSNGKTGADLLAEIQAEKAQLVKEKKIKKPKPLAPITEEEIPFAIPENWTWCRLGEISSIITDGTHHTPTYFEDGVKFLSSRNVTSGYINWDLLKYIDNEQHVEMQKRVSPKIDDILLAKNGTTGIAALVDRDEIFDIYVSLALIRTLNTNKKFILRVINSPYSKEQFDSRLRGVGVKNLHLNQIREVIVPFPPLEIQERIVTKLDELMSYCDALETQVKQSQQTNEQLLQQVLREALGA